MRIIEFVSTLAIDVDRNKYIIKEKKRLNRRSKTKDSVKQFVF